MDRPAVTRRKRVLIHALGVDIGGALRHLRGFLPALADADPSSDYVVLVKSGIDMPALPENIIIKRMHPMVTGSWAARVAYDALILPLIMLVSRHDAIVTLTNFGPIYTRTPHIFFQRNSLYYCGYYLSRISGRKRLEVRARRILAVAAMKRADIIVTPSDSMASMIRDEFPRLPGERFKTLYHGVSREVMNEPLDATMLDMISRLPGAKLLYPSHLDFYKGFQELFELLAAAKARGLEFSMLLTIDERDGAGLVGFYRNRLRELDLSAHVHLLGRIPQAQMGSLYAQCNAMVFPSLCESFGFPLLEALAHQLPVLAADTSVNREICGDAAFYFDPSDPGGSADLLANLLSEKYSDMLRASGAERIERFDWGWPRYARQFVDLVEEVCH